MHVSINGGTTHPGCGPVTVAAVRRRYGGRLFIAGVLPVLFLAPLAMAQVSYTFTSGPFGDGFNWPAENTGIDDFDSFYTPDGVSFHNFIGNRLFFDDHYQVASNASGITDEAVWGNPKDGGWGTVDILFDGYIPQIVEFDFAWAVPGAPGATPEEVYLYIEDSEGRATDVGWFLDETFPGFGGVDGQAGRITLSTWDLYDDYFNVDGEQFIDISYIYIYVDEIATFGGTTEFAIDNLDLDGGILTGEVYPSVNNGAFDVTGSTITATALRGIGTYGIGVEVTNGTNSDTNYSTQMLPGGTLTDGGQVSGDFIASGQTIYNPDLAIVNRSWASDLYHSDIRVINDNEPGDPDNDVTLAIRLLDPPSLTLNSPVDVNSGQKVRLENAAAPGGGFRAAVKVTGSSTVGPFNVAGYDVDGRALAGEAIEGDPSLYRFGYLSGGHNGTFTASLQMAYYAIGTGFDFEVFVFGAEPVPDAVWSLSGTLFDLLSDNASYAADDPVGPGIVGVNSTTTAATIVGGTTYVSGNMSMALVSGEEGTTTGHIGQAVLTNFSSAIPIHAVQMTYHPGSTCGVITEANLRLLYYNAGASNWQLAINGNTDGGSGANFFAGSFDDFVATLGGAHLDGELSAHGVDVVNNRVWAVVNHEGTFGIGEIGVQCSGIPGDFDGDGDVDGADLALFEPCGSGPAIPLTPGCEGKDFDFDNDVDQIDFGIFQGCYSGEDKPGDVACAD